MEKFATDSALALGLIEPIDYAKTGFERAHKFHEAFDMQRNDVPITPTVGERILRAKLLLEETIETIEKGLGVTIAVMGSRQNHEGHFEDWPTPISDALTIIHCEGQLYDPVETLDGLADVKVIANGTAVAFGLPMDEADHEVFASNMTKLDTDGKPIVNRCGYCDPVYTSAANVTHCEDPTHKEFWHDASKPIGKVLKSDNYVPANIKGVIEAHVELMTTNEGDV
jgi:predicted HAD superfamily Cof-like phosphohydrolase